MTSWFKNVRNFQAFFRYLVLLIMVMAKMTYYIFLKFSKDFKNDIENLPRFDINCFMTSLWRHDFLISQISKHYFSNLVHIIIVLVKMTHTIFLKMFQGFLKWYWNFYQIWFLWIYDVIMTSLFANILNYQAFFSIFAPFNHSNGKIYLFYLLESVPRIQKMIWKFA